MVAKKIDTLTGTAQPKESTSVISLKGRIRSLHEFLNRFFKERSIVASCNGKMEIRPLMFRSSVLSAYCSPRFAPPHLAILRGFWTRLD